MSEVVPDGWGIEKLGTYFSASVAGEWGSEAKGDENDIPVLRATNFSKSGAIDYTKLAIRNIEEIKRNKKLLVCGDIVIEKSGGSPTQPVGRVIYFENIKPFLYSNFTQKLSPINKCDSKYLFYKLYFEYQNGVAKKFQQQTTGIINLQLAEYLLYKTIFPPLSEQQQIASILTSVDEVIEKTEAQISKLQDLKKGMMQELLTKGIGHTEFKDSPVGRIPKSWKVNTLGDIAEFINGNSFKAIDWTDNGYPIIRIQNLNGAKEFNYYNKEINPKWYVESGSLLFAWSGQRGKSFGAHIWKGGDGVLNQHIFKVEVNIASVTKEYLHILMQQVQIEIERNAHGFKDSFMHVKKSDLTEQKIRLPSLVEQRKIVLMINSVTDKLNLSKSKFNKVSDTKKALMQDLLTGKVRVNVKEDCTKTPKTGGVYS